MSRRAGRSSWSTTSPSIALGFAAAVIALTGGCSLFYADTRPDPGAERNVTCALEYRPDPEHDGPDLLLLAAGAPYEVEQVYMNPLDALVHGLFAPGRHLSEPVRVEGARCEEPVWGKGHQLPLTFGKNNYLLCTRTGSEEVVLEVTTKWGSCRQTVPAGDLAPRCRDWYGRESHGVRRMSRRVCSGEHATEGARAEGDTGRDFWTPDGSRR